MIRRGHLASVAVLAALVATLPVVAEEGRDSAAPLAVCFPSADPPRSVRAEASGFDVDVARLVAAQLGRPLRLVWLPERGQTDIESSDLVFWPLLDGQCDMQLSIPGASAIARYGSKLQLSEPYYGAAFELVPADATLRWGEPYSGTLAVRANTVAHVAVDALGIRWTMQERTADLAAAVADGRADAALIWGPNLALTEDGLRRNQSFDPPAVLRWNLHMVVRRGDPLLAQVNDLLAESTTKSAVKSLLETHGLPARAAFPTTYSRQALDALRRPGYADVSSAGDG